MDNTARPLGTSCARTLLPYFHQLNGGGIPSEDRLQGPSLMVGPPDPTANHQDGSVVIHRPDGDLTFIRPGAPGPGPLNLDNYVELPGAIAEWGDLNGDGHADYLVNTPDGTYIISGNLRPGRYDPAKVGVLVVPRPFANQGLLGDVRPVGDQNGDGADDLALNSRLYSVRSLLSKRAGTMVHLGRPFQIIAHLSRIPALQLDAYGRPALVRVYGSFSGAAADSPLEVILGTTPPTCLVTHNRDLGTALTDRTYDTDPVNAQLVNGHRIIEMLSSFESGGVEAYRWDIDAP